jgi:hypothetical protein
MIIFDLECLSGGHRFEGWFGSSEQFSQQQVKGLLSCPQCGSSDVKKAPMAPNVARKGNQMAGPVSAPVSEPVPAPVSGAVPVPTETTPQPMAKGAMPPEALKMMQALHVMQIEALKRSRWVGDNFADDARAMHYGEREIEPIHGQTTIRQAEELLEEGIEVAPLPFPVVAPGEAN